jgi:enoyl-CoA hydratase/carnithine racemase
MSYYLPRIVGAARALEMLVADEEVHAPEAERIGLVNKVFEPDELLPAALRLAAKIAGQSPAVIEAGKRLVREDLTPGTLAGTMEQEWWAATVSRT